MFVFIVITKLRNLQLFTFFSDLNDTLYYQYWYIERNVVLILIQAMSYTLREMHSQYWYRQWAIHWTECILNTDTSNGLFIELNVFSILMQAMGYTLNQMYSQYWYKQWAIHWTKCILNTDASNGLYIEPNVFSILLQAMGYTLNQMYSQYWYW